MSLISVVIPTCRRPELLHRAVQSVLAQTYADFEILIVVDGPDDLTEAAVLERMDARIRVTTLAHNVGLAEARNVGVRRAKGRWIALLDDDDEWLPDKLLLQSRRAEELNGAYIFAPCKFIEKTMRLERVMPVRLPSSPLNFSEYIYCEQGYLQPSMFFMSRVLCLEVPFTKGLRHVEDSDWLLRAMKHPEIQLAAINQPLSVYHNYKDGKRESEMTPWQHPLEWAVMNHELFTRRAFPFYVARIGVNARRAGEPISILFKLLRTASRYGSITPKVLVYFLAYWFLPDERLKQLRAVFSATWSALSFTKTPATNATRPANNIEIR